MAGVALAFAVLSIDNSASALGLVLAANTVPFLLFLLLGGVISDRLPLTVVLRVGMVVIGGTQAGPAAGLVITGTATIGLLIALEAVNGTVMAVTFPAFTSIMPQLVPPGLLQQANALQSFSRGASLDPWPHDQRLARGRRGPRMGARRRCSNLADRRRRATTR